MSSSPSKSILKIIAKLLNPSEARAKIFYKKIQVENVFKHNSSTEKFLKNWNILKKFATFTNFWSILRLFRDLFF